MTDAERRVLTSEWLDGGDTLAGLRILLDALTDDWQPPLSDAEQWAAEPSLLWPLVADDD